ncbi:MAG: MerR family DNA-binding transcriptional regulator [Alphaproteobacteria bacterium]
MTIGKAARLSGVGVETVRFYERRGLIDQPPRPANGGFRVSPEPTGARIRFIRPAQELGCALAEFAGVLALRKFVRLDASEGRKYAYLWTEIEDAAGTIVPAVTYKVPAAAPEGRPSLPYLNLLREAARQRGLPAGYVAFLDGVEARE